MKIALVGYGKMGKIIEKIALQNNHEVVAKIDNDNDWKQFENQIKQADVAIEFSTPQTAVKNIFRCFDLNVPIVVGTTGWDEQKDEVFAYAKQHNKTLFHASNFSIGVNLFFELNRQLAELMKTHTAYSVQMEEVHHLEKLDKPSGTAITLANDLPINLSEIASLREHEVFGIHKVIYQSNEDIIEIKHEAKSREGFASGAVLAASWLVGKPAGIYTMTDILSKL